MTGPTSDRGLDDMRGVARAFSDFGYRLYREIPSDGNAFFSPFSIGVALAGLVPGARSETLAEIRATIGLDIEPEALASLMPRLLDAVGPRTIRQRVWDPERREHRLHETETYRLTMANALFVQKEYPLHTAYLDTLADSFRADFFSVFFPDTAGAAARINDWVSRKTESRISELIAATDLSELTRLVLANAVYFKARWLDPFLEIATRPQSFHLLSNGSSPVEVPTMRATETYGYSNDPTLGVEALRIPYDAAVSMLVLLPATGRFREVESALSMERVDALVAASSSKLVRLELPRFELRTSLALPDALKNLGMVLAFDMDAADFTGITPLHEGLYVSRVLHQAWVRVDEQSTEAAAATAVVIAAPTSAPRRQEPIDFVVDRPFLFLIIDERTGAVLFMGRVLDPR